MTQVTLNGNTYADDGTNRDLPTGWRTYFLQCLSDLLQHLVAFLSTLGGSLTATSATNSVVIGSGSKTLVVASPSAKGFVAGMWIVATDAANAGNSMVGQVTGYNSTTGALAFTVAASDVAGSGTPANWIIGISGRTGPAGGVNTFNGRSGAVTPQTGDYAINQLTAASYNAAGNTVQSAKLQDPRYARVDKGTVGAGVSISSVTFDVSAAPVQQATINGNVTVAFTNWPTDTAPVLLKLISGGSGTTTFTSVNFIKSDGTTQATPTRTLQSSGTDWVQVWRDNGTNYAKMV